MRSDLPSGQATTTDGFKLFDPASSTFTYVLVDPSTREKFIRLMAALDRPKPRLIDVAVPANRHLGLDIHAA